MSSAAAANAASLVGLVVANSFQISRRIGGGNWGEVFLGIGPNNQKVAFKIESKESKCPQLRHEYKVYRELIGCKGFCSIYYFSSSSVENYTVMVMSLLGPSLEDLFNKCGRRFSLKTVLQIADQLLDRVEILHSRYLIHRDIKPSNFCIGREHLRDYIFMVDFGMSKRYCNPKRDCEHMPYSDGRSLTGTPRYASINNHLGVAPTRRDDLESIGYVLIYFLKGRLPWQGLRAENHERKYGMILERKMSVSVSSLCEGCPPQFAEYLVYTRNLKYDEKPDMAYLRKLFRDLYFSQGYRASGPRWDWSHVDTDLMMNQLGGLHDDGEGDHPYEKPSNDMLLRPSSAAAIPLNAKERRLLAQEDGDDENGSGKAMAPPDADEK